MRNTITNVISKNQSYMIPRLNPLTDNSPVADGRARVGRPNHGDDVFHRAASHIAKAVKLLVERRTLRTHRHVNEGVENDAPDDNERKHEIVHKPVRVWLNNNAAPSGWSVKIMSSYLGMKARNFRFKLRYLRVVACFQLRYLFLVCQCRLLRLRLWCSESKHSFSWFVHNLILFYRNNHDGDEPPNEKS